MGEFGAGGTDQIFAGASTNLAHVFRGRYLRLTNLSGAASNPQVSEIQAWIPGLATNIARGRPVIASGVTLAGYPATNIIDGGYVGSTTMSHPSANSSSPGFYYQVDLGAVYALNRVVVWNRTDCCNTRLTNYRVLLYADNAGTPGAVNWQADIRTDGSDSGLGGSDTVLASASTNPAHVFRGRFVRVQYLGSLTDQPRPQIAELEAFPEPPPTVGSFLTTAGNIGGTGLPANTTLSWSVTNADTVSISGGIGTVSASGSTTVAPASTTTYTLNATRAGFASTTSTVTIAVNATALAPKITELQAADGLLEDEDGDRGDWVEIFNPNTHTLVLTDYALTDNAAAPAKWTFPLANVAPGGYLVVFADDKDRRVAGAPLHTNFALSAGGDYLALHAPGGALVQRLPASYPTPTKFPKQANKATYGLDGAGAEKFRPATPGAANGGAFDGVVEDTTFSTKRGIYSSAQTVAITTPTSGATIRYTTNGDEPSESAARIPRRSTSPRRPCCAPPRSSPASSRRTPTRTPTSFPPMSWPPP